MTHLITPTINLNGSSVADLVDPRLEAIDHLLDAVEALRKVTPNGRDYPAATERCLDDRSEHYRRMGLIAELREQLYAEAVAIKRQGE